MRPENTLEGFRYAIECGVDAIEMDIAVTADDVPVVSHDPWLRGRRPIRKMSYADLRRAAPAIPSLPEVLALAGCGPFLFNIELKSFPERPELAPEPAAFAALVWPLVEPLAARAMVQSFDFRVLRAIHGLAPDLRLGALFERARAGFAALAHSACAQIAVPRFSLVTAARVAAAHREGIAVYTWTVNRPDDWRRMIDAGVDAIITDDPAGLLASLSQ